jgi:hypothetical protein
MAAKRYKSIDNKTGKVTTFGEVRAYELFIGGLVGFISLADQMKFAARHTAALFDLMKDAVYRAPPAALVAVYDKLGNDNLPREVRAAILAKPNGARKPTARRARPKAARAGRRP